MSINISKIFQGLNSQQLPALINILKKADEYASEVGVEQAHLLESRLHEDMHPLIWQIQTSLELLARGGARLVGDEPGSISLEETEFLALVPQVEQVMSQIAGLDSIKLNDSHDQVVEIPIGPEAMLKLSGNDYVLKFLLPNFYFHLSTTYDILRMKGVPLGKRDFMGPITQ